VIAVSSAGELLKSKQPHRRRRRDGRVAEGARLESVFTRKGNVGSNPTLSAISFVIYYLQAGDTYTTPEINVPLIFMAGPNP
jgi:hypothetical protein